MKKLRILLAAIAITFSATAFANNPSITSAPKPNDQISKQIWKLLENPSFVVEEAIEAEVTFTLNGDNEIVVLSVDTTNEVVDDYIKSSLNYNKLDLYGKKKSKEYKVTVSIQK